MNEETLKEVIDKYPQGFLTQLGEELHQVVGLGEVSDTKQNGYIKIEADVRIRNRTVGIFSIVFMDGRLETMVYEGEHPLYPGQKVGVCYARYESGLFGMPFIREDGFRKINFPGHGMACRYFREVAPTGIDVPVIRDFNDERIGVPVRNTSQK